MIPVRNGPVQNGNGPVGNVLYQFTEKKRWER